MSKALVFATATVLEIFYRHLVSKALVFATATVLEIFYQHLVSKALVFATATVLEIFYRQDLWEKALLLVPPAELEIF